MGFGLPTGRHPRRQSAARPGDAKAGSLWRSCGTFVHKIGFSSPAASREANRSSSASMTGTRSGQSSELLRSMGARPLLERGIAARAVPTGAGGRSRKDRRRAATLGTEKPWRTCRHCCIGFRSIGRFQCSIGQSASALWDTPNRAWLRWRPSAPSFRDQPFLQTILPFG
jgi:hypothetical protein